MIVPQHWAEARVQHKTGPKQITVKRFGWSEVSPEEAQSNANTRAREALKRIMGGETLARTEPKVAYNGAEGVPIREEILSRHGDSVITRNVYGARCLNSPKVLFADVDFAQSVPLPLTLSIYCLLILAAMAYGISEGSARLTLGLGVVVLFLGYLVSGMVFRAYDLLMGGSRKRALRRIRSFANSHPEWHVRAYETPAGYRVLVMHDVFDPSDARVVHFFEQSRTDPVYSRMCLKQHCFRARVSPKPWRIGIGQHLRPRPGIWPVQPERMPERQRWIEAYELKAAGYASCRFLESLGSPTVHAETELVRAIHDTLSKADSALPIA